MHIDTLYITYCLLDLLLNMNSCWRGVWT